ncbi:MoxR family ATPase [Caldalkalibacillus salinus]|uniref:AAA family ATPase n=1 Tax=Caldalkalibacillus salinus TaxID=2803787 RepID=UPI003019FB74
MALTTQQQSLIAIKNNIENVIIGKGEVIEQLIIAMIANGHVLLEDVPGTGKTVLAKTLAKTVNGEFKRIQFTPDVLPSDVTGIHFFDPKEQQFELRLGPIYTNILLADEINRTTPRTQSSLLEGMEERQVTIDGQTVTLPSPFFVIATQNPVESQGTFPLPEAQLDRFLMKIRLGYPTFAEEYEVMQRFKETNPLERIEAITEADNIMHMQKEAMSVYIDESVSKYMLSLVRKTREHPKVEVGISPRGTLALMRTAQAKAYVSQRAFVTPDDVKAMFPLVGTHRLMLTLDAQLHGTAEDIIQEITETIEVPVEEVGER